MSNFIKYPSISKFNDIIKAVNKKNKPVFSHVEISEDGKKTPVFTEPTLPVLKFQGTVKLHGTNAAVVLNSDFTVDAQSRTRTLSLTSDNHGFCSWVVGKSELFVKAYKYHLENLDVFSLHIFGEWCGGNIQSNVGLMGVEKTFVIFGILQTNVDDTQQWLSPEEITYMSDKENNIRNIFEFPTYELTIDMNNPSEGLSEADKLRDQIDTECPVALDLGSTSECKHGEGNVWTCIAEGYEELRFKHKGESHQRGGKKVKQQKIKEALTEEQQKAYDDFITEACKIDRLAQGIEYLLEQGLEVHQKYTGQYLKWIFQDIQKECVEEITEVCKTDLTWKSLTTPISRMAKEFFFSEVNKI